MSRATALTTAALHGEELDPGQAGAADTEAVLEASRMVVQAKATAISTWNQGVDAVFNPIIRELHRRGW